MVFKGIKQVIRRIFFQFRNFKCTGCDRYGDRPRCPGTFYIKWSITDDKDLMVLKIFFIVSPGTPDGQPGNMISVLIIIAETAYGKVFIQAEMGDLYDTAFFKIPGKKAQMMTPAYFGKDLVNPGADSGS